MANSNSAAQNQSTVQPQNETTMSQQNVATAQHEVLTNEEIQLLTEKMPDHFEVQNGTIVDTFNDVELTVTVETKGAREIVRVQSSASSFKVNREVLDAEEIRNRKKKRLAEKAQDIIYAALSQRELNRLREQDIEYISSAIKSKANSLGKYSYTEYNEEIGQYIAYFQSGRCHIEKEKQTGKFKLIIITKYDNSEL
jgi:hypothetical protein